MVYFVGAGPGDPDLITVKGQRLISQADTIIYAGSLVNPDLLQGARFNAKICDSSKMNLQEIISVMKKAEPGITVRLHTGDPSLYGAIREQMEELDAAGIPYRIVPGVSSFSAAAAALQQEYTVPDGNQTLIITREAGRTQVPEKQSLPSLAGHGAAMAIFLSAGLAKQVQAHLIEGGYGEDTPAAIVYRASWPDERVVSCTVGTLAKGAAEGGIEKQALILVGDFLDAGGGRSKLYDPAFSTDVRAGEKSGIAVACFTEAGEALAKTLAPLLEKRPDGTAQETEAGPVGRDPDTASCPVTVTRIGRGADRMPLSEWTKGNWYTKQALVFIGAAGIAVRAIAPLAKKKTIDPAVLVLDEDGKYVIPLLSGHMGGAVRLARKMAVLTGGTAVITTASDGRGAFAVDSWATDQGLLIDNPEKIVDVTGALLAGKSVSMRAEVAVTGPVPEGIVLSSVTEGQVLLTPYETDAKDALHLIVPVYVGIGMRRGTGAGRIEAAFRAFLQDQGINPAAVRQLYTIDLKKDEAGLLFFAKEAGLSLTFFSAEELKRAAGDFTASDFVKEVTGVDNVCERAAALGAGPGGRLLVKKSVYDGITFAAALPQIAFPEG